MKTSTNTILTKKERQELKKQQKISYKEVKQNKENTIRIIKKSVIIIGILLLSIFIWKLFTAPLDSSEDPKNILQVKSDDWSYGNKDAPVQLIEYLDFECEACRAYHPLIQQLKQDMDDDLLVVTRYFPLPGHKNSMNAAIAVEAAGKQGKYWEMSDVLFKSQSEWGEGSSDANIFSIYAKELGLDMVRFENDRKNPTTKSRVERNKNEGPYLKIQGTPSFFLNGEKIQNPKSIEDFKILIQAAKLRAPMQNGEIGKKVHEHADIVLYIDDKKFDFSDEKYQSTKEKPLNDDTHLHDGNGNNVHKHRTKITMGDFFTSLGIEFNKDCFILDTGERYCSEGDKKLQFFVNGAENNQFDNYEFSDLDRLLITYGDTSSEVIQKQISSVTDQACLYSEKCPERGKPPTENCAVGLGGDC